jgi:hypothetical protein
MTHLGDQEQLVGARLTRDGVRADSSWGTSLLPSKLSRHSLLTQRKSRHDREASGSVRHSSCSRFGQPRLAAVLASRHDPIIWTGADLRLPLVTKSSGAAAARQTEVDSAARAKTHNGGICES